jgi:hypothetical protein
VLKADSTNLVIFDCLALQLTENFTGMDRIDRIFDLRFLTGDLRAAARQSPIKNQKSEI